MVIILSIAPWKADTATGVEDFYPREQTQTAMKPCFYPRLSVFTDNYKSLTVCAHASGRLLRMITFQVRVGDVCS